MLSYSERFDINKKAFRLYVALFKQGDHMLKTKYRRKVQAAIDDHACIANDHQVDGTMAQRLGKSIEWKVIRGILKDAGGRLKVTRLRRAFVRRMTEFKMAQCERPKLSKTGHSCRSTKRSLETEF